MARKAGQGEEEEVAQSQEAKREDASPPWREEDVGVTVKTSNTILKRYGESGQPYSVPDFSGISLSFSPFTSMLGDVDSFRYEMGQVYEELEDNLSI
ncbi:hypothetical protein STEG23_033009 [Scotinomys teguina]